jgi:hypothetical protein
MEFLTVLIATFVGSLSGYGFIMIVCLVIEKINRGDK